MNSNHGLLVLASFIITLKIHGSTMIREMPNSNGGDTFILFNTRKEIAKIDMKTMKNNSVVSELQSTIAIDLDFRTGIIVWSNTKEGKINSAPIDTGTPVTTIIRNGAYSTVDGIAIDWIYGHIYWTDTSKDTIEMADKTGEMSKVLITLDLDEPRAIVLNPLDGWMYWTDWGVDAKIERAGMDGSHRSVIISSNLRWPNGLAIDFVSQKIYWADAKLHTLSYADYDGHNQKVVLYSPSVLQHPFAIDVFEDWIYWTDWRSSKIHRMNKFNGENITNVFFVRDSPMDIHIFYPNKQPDGVNYCNETNTRCSHLCLPSPIINPDSPRHTCACPDGMSLTDGGITCTFESVTTIHSNFDADEITIVPFTLSESKPFILFNTRKEIGKVDLETLEYDSVVRELQSTVAIDFDFRTGTIVWSNTEEGKINSAPIDTGTPVTTIIRNGVYSTVDGIAIDWIYGHIYWTDTSKDTIEMADKTGKMSEVLISLDLDEPRAIVLNPLDGWMYWTDWGVRPKIERAGMDGSHRRAIVSSNLRWPNGLAIDFVSQKIYWADAKLHTLSYADYDGRNQKVVLYSPSILQHPFSIDVFEDWIYWTDWRTSKIHRINKFNGESKTNVFVLQDVPMDIHIYHRFKQPQGINYCNEMNARCSHLCLPSPIINPDSPRHTCACPDGMSLTKDGITCVLESVSSTTHSNLETDEITVVPFTSSAILSNSYRNLETDEITDVPFTSSELSTQKDVGPVFIPLSGERNCSMQNENPHISNGHMAGIIIGVLAGVIIILSMVALIIYRKYLRIKVTSTSIANPIYGKDMDDQFRLSTSIL